MRFSEQRWDAFGGSPSESSAYKYGTRGVAISARKPQLPQPPQLSAGETLLAALARRDFAAVEATLDPAVRFRALTPSRLIEAAGAAETVAYPRRWFGAADSFDLLAAEVSDVAGRQRLGYRFRLHDEDGWQVIEQHAYADVDPRGGTITALDVLCSGFRQEDVPLDAPHAAADVPSVSSDSPAADATLDARGEGCATLTPLIRARMRELESGQVLEVRSDDPAAREGVPAWCRLTGNALAAADTDGDVLRFYLRKK